MTTEMQPQTRRQPCEGLLEVKAKQDMFKWWQEQQNGTLKDIKASVAGLDKKFDDKTDTLVKRIDEKVDALVERIDAKVAGATRPQTEMQTWVRNSLYGALIFVAGVLANSVVK